MTIYELNPPEETQDLDVSSESVDEIAKSTKEETPQDLKKNFRKLWFENVKEDLNNSLKFLEKSTAFNSGVLMVGTAAVLFPAIGGPLLVASLSGVGFYGVVSVGKALTYGGYKAAHGVKIESQKQDTVSKNSEKVVEDTTPPQLVQQKEQEKTTANEFKKEDIAPKEKEAQNQKEDGLNTTKKIALIIAMLVITLIASLYAPWALPLIIGIASPVIANNVEKVIGGGEKTTKGITMVMEGACDLSHGRKEGLEKIISGGRDVHDGVKVAAEASEALFNNIDEERQKVQQNVLELKKELVDLKNQLTELKKAGTEITGGIKKIAVGDSAGVDEIASGGGKGIEAVTGGINNAKRVAEITKPFVERGL